MARSRRSPRSSSWRRGWGSHFPANPVSPRTEKKQASSKLRDARTRPFLLALYFIISSSYCTMRTVRPSVYKYIGLLWGSLRKNEQRRLGISFIGEFFDQIFNRPSGLFNNQIDQFLHCRCTSPSIVQPTSLPNAVCRSSMLALINLMTTNHSDNGPKAFSFCHLLFPLLRVFFSTPCLEYGPLPLKGQEKKNSSSKKRHRP